MDIIGTIVGMNPMRQGTSANGTQWASQDFVAQIGDPNAQYPSHLVFSVFGADKLQQFNIQHGQTYRIFFDFRGRQAQDGRWFGSVNCWKIEPHNTQQPLQQQNVAQQPQQFPQQTAQQPAADGDLPF